MNKTTIGIVLLLISILFADSECLLIPVTLVAISVWLLKGALTDDHERECKSNM